MKKQIQIILFAGLLVAGIAACGGNKSGSQSDSTNTSAGAGGADSANSAGSTQSDSAQTDSVLKKDTATSNNDHKVKANTP
jgi:hypothetical protein